MSRTPTRYSYEYLSAKRAAAQPELTTVATMAFAPMEVAAGSKEFGHVPVVDSLAVSTSLPVGVVRGQNPGPTLAITAGLFPSEYCGIEAASRLYALTEPGDLLCGTLVVLPCVNLHGFQ